MLPFEEAEGLPFEEAASLPFEQQSKSSTKGPLDWALNPEDDRDRSAVVSDAKTMAREQPLRMIGDAMVGIPEAIVGMVSTLPAMVAGGAAGLSSLVQGRGAEESADTTGKVMQEFTYQPRTTTGQVLTHGIGDVFEESKTAAGKAGNLLIPGSEAFSRTAGEGLHDAALGIMPFGAKLRGMQVERQNMGRAQGVLDQGIRGDTEYSSWERDQAVNAEYAKQLAELDNVMLRYDAELQAPQLGKGGKVAKHADQAGKREKGEYAAQDAFDAELARIKAEQDSYTYQQRELAYKEQPMTIPSPMLDQGRRPVETKTNIKGPEGDLITDADAIASEVREIMRPREQDPKDVEGNRTIQTMQEYKDLIDKTVMNEMQKQGLVDDMGRVTDTKVYNEIKEYLTRNLNSEGNNVPGYSPRLESVQRHSKPQWRSDGQSSELTSSRQQLQTISQHSQTPLFKELARLFLNDKDFNPRFTVRDNSYDAPGRYSPSEYRVNIREQFLGDEGLTLHEYGHARLHGAIELVRRNPDDNPHLKLPVQRLQTLYLSLVDELALEGIYYNKDAPMGYGPGMNNYGLLNIHEFTSDGWTTPEFQKLMDRPLPKELHSAFAKTYWDAFVEAFSKIIGFDRTSRTYLSEFIKTGAEIMNKSTSVERRAFEHSKEGAGFVQDSFGGYSYREFKADLDAKGIKVSDAAARAMHEAQAGAEAYKQPPAHPQEASIKVISNIKGLKRIQQEYKDQRPYDEIIKESVAHGDVGMVKKNITAKGLPGKFMVEDHPLWSHTSSQIHEIKNGSMQSAMDRLHGKSRTAPDPGTYNYVWRQLTSKERQQVNEFGFKYNNAEAAISGAELSKLAPKLRQAYLDRVEINKKVLNDVNQVLIAEGKEPIPALPNYWAPTVLDKPFIVKFKDASGETKKIEGFYLKPNEKTIQALAKEHGMAAELQPERGQRGELDFEQFDWVLRQLAKEQRDPAARALSEGRRRQGFMKHGLKRKGVEGGEGSGGGRRGLREYEEVSEKYIRRAYEWIANRKIDTLYKKILDEKALDAQPYAKGYALEALDTARGGANTTMEGLSKMLGDIVSGTVQVGTLGAVKLPNRFLRDLLRNGNKVATTNLLGFGNLTNAAVNIIQAGTYAPPAMIALAAKAGLSTPQLAAAGIRAMVKAGTEMLKWDQSKDVQRLREIGALDATFKYDWSTYASDADPRYSSNLAEHLTGISTLSKIESDAVRRPAALMFLNMLREIGYEKISKDKNEIYYVAKEMTDKYMVSTRWYEKPHMFSRTGLAGTALSPLQSFTTTWLGMFREFTKLAAEGVVERSFAKTVPLGVFMSMNVLTSGLLGLIGVKEWDMLANLANKYFGYNIPTGTEYIMSKFKDTKLRFGIISDALGVHVGASMNAPTMTGSFAPGVQLLGNTANFGMQQGRKAANSLGMDVSAPTAVENRDSWKGVTPRFNWMDRALELGGLPSTKMNWADRELEATPPGRPYQDMAGNAGPVTRTDADWTARKLGTYTIREAKEKTKNYLGKKEGTERSERLSKAMTRAADIIVMNPDSPDIMERIEPIIRKLEKDGFSGTDIKTALKRELMAKIIESDTRMVGKGRSTRQAYVYKLLRELD